MSKNEREYQMIDEIKVIFGTTVNRTKPRNVALNKLAAKNGFDDVNAMRNRITTIAKRHGFDGYKELIASGVSLSPAKREKSASNKLLSRKWA